MFRISGELTAASDEIIERAELEELVTALLGENRKAELERKGEVLAAYTVGDICRVRVCVFRQRGSYAMTMRLLPLEIPNPSELLLPAALSEWKHKKSGLILIAGMAGSGKSTTLASVVKSLAAAENKTVVTAERTLEYLYADSPSVVYQREIGRDAVSGAAIVHTALQQDIDIVAVAEPEDVTVVEQSLLAAETGQLVFLVVAAGSVSGAIEELTAHFPAQQQERVRKRIANVLIGVTVQKLLPRADGTGRVAAFAVMQTTPAIRNLIREDKMEQLTAMMQSEGKEDMNTMDDAIYEMYMKSRISAKNAVLYAEDSVTMMSKI